MINEKVKKLLMLFDSVLPPLKDCVLFAIDGEYDKALQIIDDCAEIVEDEEYKSVAALMSVQVMAMAGYKEISSILLKSILSNLKTDSRARNLCQRTINELQ